MTSSKTIDQLREDLLTQIGSYGSCAVALSGGVDSAVVAKAAHLALGDNAMAVTGVSASLAEGELDAALDIARQIGIPHQVIRTQEFAKPQYIQNAPDRCYHCKTELYTQLEQLAAQCGVKVILNGANADDAGDYRPGMIAATEHQIRSPLLECGISKQDVRELAAHWQLKVWDKPASPCLSSRVAYGEEVTPERLRMIDRAEQFLRTRGFGDLRIRYHRGDLARVEVSLEQLPKFVDAEFRSELVEYLQSLGFKFITLDLCGFRSGSLNALVGTAQGLVSIRT